MSNLFLRIEDKKVKNLGQKYYPLWDDMLYGYSEDAKSARKCLKYSIIAALLVLAGGYILRPTGVAWLSILWTIMCAMLYAVDIIFCFIGNTEDNKLKYVAGFVGPVIGQFVIRAIMDLFAL